MRKVLCAVTLLSALCASSASATTIGYFLSGTTGSPAAAITANGFTAEQLSNLTPADLVGINVLWILNGINGNPDPKVTANAANIAAFVAAGGVLSYSDRDVAQGSVPMGTILPGGAGISFTTSPGSEIDVLNGSVLTTNGPFGTISGEALDGGNFSDHGYVSLASLPAGAVPILSTDDHTHIVDFYYRFGAGFVDYSTIPLDFYLAGNGNNPPANTIRNIYAPNEADLQATLATPEPASLILLGSGVLGLVARRRKARQ